MNTVFYARLHGIFIEIQSNLRNKNLHRMNQSYNFFGGSFSNTSILKDDFSSRTDPSIFTSVAPVLLDQSNKTS